MKYSLLPSRWLHSFVIAVMLTAPAAPSESATGVTISYRLPTTGPLPKTYRVTLAITDPKDPDWIVSTFIAGAPRTVTKENQGKFTETWNGLDDNFMPVPPGTYGVKGIYMPARLWSVDHAYHSFIPKFVAAAGDSWMNGRGQEDKRPWLWGAGYGTLADVAIMDGRKAVFYHNYYEGTGNPLVIDLSKPIGFNQVVQEFSPSGIGGGPAIASDGELIWAVSKVSDAPNFIFRADRKPFGHGRARGLADVYIPGGTVTSLAAWRNPASHRHFVYAAQTGSAGGILVLDGENGDDLATLPLAGIRSVAVSGSHLFALHRDPHGQWLVSRTGLGDGVPSAHWERAFVLSGISGPTDVKVDRHGFAYVSDLRANQVYKIAPSGEVVFKFGRAEAQRPGHYNDHVFMSPGKLALWTDKQGKDHLIIVERSGPGRVSEWTTNGRLLRQWFPGQAQAIGGYAVDPDDPEHIYMATSEPANGSGLVRFRVDYRTGKWSVDAVWPEISAWRHFPGGIWYPKIINHAGRKYLAFARNVGGIDRYGYMIYRLEGERWIPSAGILPDPDKSDTPPAPGAAFWWHDANGDGKVEQNEYRHTPARLPTPLRYFGDTWLDDLSLVLIEDGGRSVWRIAPSGFDAHGNPIYDGKDWRKLLTDTAFEAHASGDAPSLHGGNEVGDSFNLPWAMIDGDMQHGFLLQAYSGPSWPEGIDSTGRYGSQVKVTYYRPDRHGGFTQQWRVGRKAFGLAQPGEMYGTLHVTPPINHVLGLQDGNGLFHLFSDEGLYLDTLLVDHFRGGPGSGGVYDLAGEMFNGFAFLNKQSGKVYLTLGRDAAIFFEIEGWAGSGRLQIARVQTLPKTVQISARQIAAPPEFALRARGGAAKAKTLRIQPATGGSPALDGSLHGWEMQETAIFGLDHKRQVEVRMLYDPKTLYVRWHVRLPYAVPSRGVSSLDRLFTDREELDTVSLYVQDDPRAAPPAHGRPRVGDVRIVFALVKIGDQRRPVAVAFYPYWSGAATPHPVLFSSLVGREAFANVQPLSDAKLGYKIDEDQDGFVLSAAIPLGDLPSLPKISSTLATTMNFDATFAGKAKVWWANADGSASTITSDEPSEAALYPGSWAPAQFVGLSDSMAVAAWSVSGPWGGEGLRGFDAHNPRDQPHLIRVLRDARYPPDDRRPDWSMSYSGPLSLDIGGKPHAIRWQIARSRISDGALHFDQSAGVYFGAAWIFVAEAQDVNCRLSTGPQTAATLWINNTEVPHHQVGNPPFSYVVPDDDQTIHFLQGWNRVYLRAYTMTNDLQFGMVLHAPPEALWQIRVWPTPP